MSRKRSILQEEKVCFLCGTTLNLELHHVLHGTAMRKIADKLGLTVWLCSEHHRGKNSPHMNKAIDTDLKRFAQSEYEKRHDRFDWMAKVGRNYL
jgi:hypothetical protein